MYSTRFAPSPTGPLHLGHAFSALTAFDRARADGGRCLLRIEDIDRARARPAWEAQIYDDLAWLGLRWPKPVLRQSDRAPAYSAALNQLADQGLLYPCRCRRTDIEAAAAAPQEGGPQFGPDGRIYPGTCRARPMSDRQPGDVLRLNLARALSGAPELAFEETGPLYRGHHRLDPDSLIATIGDPVLERRGMAGSYHLCVVVDDGAQDITEVVRGADLFEATVLHVLVQHLLGLPVVRYHHHRLIRDDAGKRLAKRDDARSLGFYRSQGLTPEDIRAMVGL
ncbi:MAG: tRNA glutamyl-Q(34) synthetase GluQRS [Pseudomonadota bacterium]